MSFASAESERVSEERQEPESARLFVAIVPPAEILHRVDAICAKLRTAHAQGFGWVTTERMHFTLAFLGAVEIEQVPTVAAALRSAVAPFVPFDVELDGLGTFPERGKPRVLWIGAREGASELIAVAAAVIDAACAFGKALEDERERFHPHLTLARIKREAGPLRQGEIESANTRVAHERLRFRAERASLIRSVLGRGGPTYTVVEELPFGG
jgi:2'-5' RNA ligase